jgi:uncharacterized repeat protein (TIGR01451 family)
MKRLIERTVVALVLGIGLALTLLWALSNRMSPAARATAPGPETAGQAQRPPLQAGNVLTVCPAVVGTCPYTNIQAAVDTAHDGDVIKVAAGTYTGTNMRPAPLGYAGPSIITQVVYVSKTVTIQGGYTVTNWTAPDPGANPTTLDAQEEGRVLYIAGDISPTITGLRITGGDADRLGGHIVYESIFDGGGGVYALTATAVISGNDVFGNAAGAGGGLYLRSSDSLLHGNTITSNVAGDGGGLYLYDSAATIDGNTVSANTAHTYGGALYLENSPAALRANTFAANVGYYSGGLHLDASGATLDGNTIISNTGSAGGGVYVEGSSVTFSGNAVVANHASRGGGVYVGLNSDAALTNDVFADNRASLEGSGLYIFASLTRLRHTTIARNSDGDGSGVHVADSSYLDAFSDVALTNTILVSHAVGINVATGNTATLEATLWGTGTWANATDWSGAGTIFTGTTHVRGDPAFVGPDAGDYHIRLASAAVDRGVDAGVDVDRDGDPRPLGHGIDIGADETGLIVTKRGTPNPVRPGARLTYTVQVANVSDVALTATITDTLPPSVALCETSGGTLVLPGGTPGATRTLGITWTAGIPAGGEWTEQIVVTVEVDHTGSLVNVVEVTSDQGATGTASYASMTPTIYLPLVMRRWPPIPYQPTLYPIDNADGDDSYVVSWAELPSRLAITYTLQEATDAAFTTGLRQVCATIQQSCTVSGNLPGTYYYSVQGQNAWGYGAWSKVQAATVGCPTTSTHQYSSGTAYQYDPDDPVRPAYNHADKNLELRGYTPNTDPDLQRELVDYGSADPTQPPQLATLFSPNRVPAFSGFYQVHHWNWAPSPAPGTRGDPITSPPVTALGMQSTPGEILYVPTSGYNIGGGMEAIVLFADEDTISLKYARQDSAGAPGYTVHIDNICTDPNLLALYNQLDDPAGPRYVFPNARYDLPILYDGQPFGTAQGTEIVVAIVDTGAFMDTRSCNEWWQIRPGYTGTCPPPQSDGERRYGRNQDQEAPLLPYASVGWGVTAVSVAPILARPTRATAHPLVIVD